VTRALRPARLFSLIVYSSLCDFHYCDFRCCDAPLPAAR
jgi:hypothetical protein